MISVAQAKDLVLKNYAPKGSENLPLDLLNKRILAKNLVSPINHPYFDQSAVDGYAFNFKRLINNNLKLSVIGEIQAGGHTGIKVVPGKCVRIFTGAPVPAGTDTVVMQEDVIRDGNSIIIGNKNLKKGANVRVAGEQIKKGGTALIKGTELNPAAIGFLASLGIEKARVSKLPVMRVIITGNEFSGNEKELKKGKIFESNGKMLHAMLLQMGISAPYEVCGDTLSSLSERVKLMAKQSDILLLTGGVSVGDYDFTENALRNNGFNIIFHKVNQKPGKPLLFAKKGNKAAFGLPGNPRAVCVCFYQYVYPYIRIAMGANAPFLKSINLPLSHDYSKNNDKKVHFIDAIIKNDCVELMSKQSSHMLKSSAEADGLVEIPEVKKNFSKGDLVKLHLNPVL